MPLVKRDIVRRFANNDVGVVHEDVEPCRRTVSCTTAWQCFSAVTSNANAYRGAHFAQRVDHLPVLCSIAVGDYHNGAALE